MTTTLASDPRITFAADELRIHFDQFGLDHYDLFLRAKRLPESRVEFHEDSETYSIVAPARFASVLGVDRPERDSVECPLSDRLYDDQAAIIRMALDAKRFACWSDCGLGKTLVGLEWGRQVVARTGGRVLITTFGEVVPQWVDEARDFYGDDLPVRRIESRADMRAWCAGGDPGLAVTNYEKWNPESLDAQVVREARHLAGFVADESSRLKTGGGKQKWAIIKSTKGVEYKLSLTATPAPNDVMEFASQASFLEKMRNEEEILWTYFTRHPKTHRWTVRPHARAAFFEFMAGWSIYVRDPKRYGWRAGSAEIPPPETIVHEIGITPEQRRHLGELSAESHGQLGLFATRDTNAIQRGRLSQVAKGFRYRKGPGGKGRAAERVDSLKPRFVADLIAEEVNDGHQVLVWTSFDEESTILREILGEAACGTCLRSGLGSECPHEFPVSLLTGATEEAERVATLDRFRRGEVRCLVSRASMLGFGMNFQCCTSMVFSGFSDSYEQFYQAVRRAYRHGQTRRVRVHLPVIPELEGDMLENLWRKQSDHEAAIREMEANYVAARRRLALGA